MAQFRKFSSSLCLFAAASMGVSSAEAANLAPVGMPHYLGAEIARPLNTLNISPLDAQQYHRRHRGYDDYTDVGDVIAGVLILGTIAAVVSSANKERREPPRSNPQPYPGQRSGGYNSGSQSINGAVNACVSQIERDVRVAEVSGVSRSGPGWMVMGRIYNGDGFVCDVDERGKVATINYNAGKVGYNEGGEAPRPLPYPTSAEQQGTEVDKQWSDEEYARLRSRAAPTTSPANSDYSG